VKTFSGDKSCVMASGRESGMGRICSRVTLPPLAAGLKAWHR
jgi:hypothetical protein